MYFCSLSVCVCIIDMIMILFTVKIAMFKKINTYGEINLHI